MGQIVFNGQKPKYCNLQSIQEGGLHYTDDVSLNEVWLVDTTNSTKINGTGEYNAYIIGDGSKKAGQLELHYLGTSIDISKYSTTVQMQSAIEAAINNANIPRNLSQLKEDTEHQTVSQTEKDLWGAGGSGGITNNVDHEDLTSVEVSQGVSVIKFNDKEFNASNYSGMGKKYLRKTYTTEIERSIIDITPAIGTEEEDPSEEPSETALKIRGKYMDLSAGLGGAAVEKGRGSLAYLKKEVAIGESYVFQATVAISYSTYFWAIIDKSTNIILQCGGNYEETGNPSHSEYVDVEHEGYLVVNIVAYNAPTYWIKKLKLLNSEKEFNVLTSLQSSNTVYIVSYDYDMNGRSIVLPENSVLKFEGGSIKNAVLIGNNTTIEANSKDNIFGRNTEIVGTWKNSTWYAKWFGVYSDGVQDDTKVLQKMLNLSETTGSKNIILNWYDCVFRTTKGLFIRNYTTILGGTIKAKFDNPLDWVLQTYSMYGERKVPSYNINMPWDSTKAINGGFIKDLTIKGELNDNGDGTWAPIFGGIRLMTTSMATENVDIRDVGYGMCRSATVVARDTNLVSWSYFCSYVSWYVINLEVNTAYFQAHAHTTSSGPSDNNKVIPFAKEYQPVIYSDDYSTYKNGISPFGDSYIDGLGGINDSDSSHPRPKFATFKGTRTSAVLNNIAMDYYQDIGIALGDYTEITFNTIRFESVAKCFVYLGGHYITATLNNVIVSISDPDYDIYMGRGSAELNLISAPDITCSGYGDAKATTHKLYKPTLLGLNVNVIGKRTNAYPNVDFFHFLEDDTSINLVPNGYETRFVSGQESSYNDGSNGKYILPTNLMKTNRKKVAVSSNTTVVIPNNTILRRKDITISGDNRKTSIVKLSGNCYFASSDYYTPASLEFRNVTVDCSSGYFRISYPNQGFGSKLSFINCDIIAGANGIIAGDSNYSILFDVLFDACTIYSKYEGVFNAGNVYIGTITLSPVIRYGKVQDSNSKNVNVNLAHKGNVSNRNLITYHVNKGHIYYNISTGRNEVWNNRQWVLEEGYPYTLSKGITANVPALPLMKIGTEYNDTEIGVKKVLTANGTCGYGTFAFNAVFPISTKTFYVGTTAVTPDSNGAFSVNLPTGTYPVYCVEGDKKYECQPSTITISGGTTFPIYIKESRYSTKFEIKIDAVDGNGEFIQGLTVRVGPYVATENTTGKYYSINLPNGQYMITADGYADQTSLYVNGLADRVTATFETEAPTNPETVVLDGYLYDHDHICDSNGTIVVAGKYNVSIDSTSLEVSVTETDLSTILYFIDDNFDAVNKQLACLLMKKWFEAGHYGELSGNSVKLYSDTVGATTGNTATFTDTNTNLVCTVTHTAGTNATWEDAPSGEGSSNSSMNIVAASGTSLTANVNTYYTFAAAVNTLAVTLPAMTDVTSVKALCLAFTAGTTPQITFTSADSKMVAYYDTYDIDAECEYEVTCLYNGTKWIVSSALIS